MTYKDIILRLSLAFILGAITGMEREKSNQFAGLRTHILVSIGACLASLTSLEMFYQYKDIVNLDPARLSAQVLSGIGFLGAGTIMKVSDKIKGLTTAAGLWVTACLGISIGYGYYVISIFSWLIVIISLNILKNIEINNSQSIENSITIMSSNVENTLSELFTLLENEDITIKNLNIEKSNSNYENTKIKIIYESYNKDIIKKLYYIEDVKAVEIF